MTSPKSTRLLQAALLPLVLLAGCATDTGRRGAEAKAAGGMAFQVFVNPALPLSSKSCMPGDPVCAIQIERTTERPVQLPDGTWDCKIAVTDVLLVPQSVKTLQWRLPPNQAGAPAFRFTEPKGDNGVWTYADTSGLFVRERPSDTELRFVVRSDFKKGIGYAYGIRLEWQESPKAPWLPCAPRDPIIVSLD